MLQFAAAYGFRNIQNIVQKLKRKKCPYHYIEVMACPSGMPSCCVCVVAFCYVCPNLQYSMQHTMYVNELIAPVPCGVETVK